MRDIKYEKLDKVYSVKKKKLSSKKKVIYLFVGALLFIGFALFCISRSLSLKEKSVISYNELGNIDYKVYLKQNNYYPEKYLGKDMQYIASLINTINVDFNYEIHSTEIMDYSYDYKILATLRITDKTNKNKVLYKKDEVLVDTIKKTLQDNNFVIHEDVVIDYDKYNSYATQFRKDYSLTANAEIVLKMVINTTGYHAAAENELNRNNKLEMAIPLSEQTIDITMDASKINYNDSIKCHVNYQVNDIVLFVTGIVYFAINLIVLIYVIYLYITRYSSDPYASALHKILKEYDTYIVNAKSDFKEHDNITKVATFAELLDAQKIEGSPILFYEVEPNNKSYFVVNGAKNTYRFTLTRAYQIKLLQENKKEDL